MSKSNSGFFPETMWEIVHSAGSDDLEESRQSFESLYLTYSRPVEAYLLTLGCPKVNAGDLTQEVFRKLYQENGFRNLKRENGRLRSFLCKVAQNTYWSYLRKEKAKKRNQGKTQSLEELTGDSDHADAAVPGFGSEEFDREWALFLVESVKVEMIADKEGSRKEAMEALFDVLLARRQMQDDELAGILGLTLRGARAFRNRFQEIFREKMRKKVAVTLPKDCDVKDMDAEILYLMRCLIQAG